MADNFILTATNLGLYVKILKQNFFFILVYLLILAFKNNVTLKCHHQQIYVSFNFNYVNVEVYKFKFELEV